MWINYLAVVVPAGALAGDDKVLREAVWQQTAGLLLPQLGKQYTRFQPARQVWKQAVNRPFGVVVGRSDPALFLYLYTAAKSQQECAIRFHLEKFMDGVDVTASHEQPGISVLAVEVKGGADVESHMQWHFAMLSGALLPDCGLYYLAEKQAFADDALDRRVLSHLDDYALCMVALMREDNA